MKEDNTKDNSIEKMTESSEVSKNLMKGATILVAAGIVSKIFGAVFRIPLTNMIGAEGQAYYGAAYPVYQFFFTIATAGFPVAISRMVSSRIAKGDYINAHKSYKLAFKLSAALGAISFLIMFFGAGAIANFYKLPGAEASMRAVSFALLLTPMLASLRGYYQGRQNMMPTALTEIFEQLFRVIVGLSLAFAFYKTSLERAAAGATFGASAGVLCALVIMLLIYKMDSGRRNKLMAESKQTDEGERRRLNELISYIVPITIGAAIMPIMFNIDTAIVPRRLLASGWDAQMTKKLFGLISGYCDPIIAMPGIFVDAICISMMPAITTAFTLKVKKDLDNHIKTGLKTMMIIAYPCAIGLIVLGKPILRMLYMTKIEEADMAVPTLQILAFGIIAVSVMRTLAASLQGIGKMNLPVINLCVGLVIKAISSYVLVAIPALNIKGAAIGSVLAYITAASLNYLGLKKHANINIDFKDVFIKPFAAAALMGIGTIACFKMMFMISNSNALSAMVAILVAVLIYFVTVFKTKVLTREEVELIPKGDLVYRIAQKIKIAD